MTARTERTLREMLDAMASRVSEAPAEDRESRFESEFEDSFPELVRVRLACDEISYRPERVLVTLEVLKASAHEEYAEPNTQYAARKPALRILIATGLALAACIGLLVWFGMQKSRPVAHAPAERGRPIVAKSHPNPDRSPLVDRTPPHGNGSPVLEQRRNHSAPLRKAPKPAPIPHQEGPIARRVEVGKTGQVTGWPKMTISGQNKVPNLKEGTSLYADSAIETGDTDKLQIKLDDGSKLSLNFNTRVVLHSVNDKGNVRQYEIELEKGHIWAQVKHLGPSDRFAVRTPVATAVALGTEFGVQLRSSRAKKPEAVLSVLEGRVVWSNAFGHVEATSMMQSLATADAAPTEPKRLQVIQSQMIQPGLNLTVTTNGTSLGSASMRTSTTDYGPMRLVADLGWIGAAADDVVPVDPMGSPGPVGTLGRQVRIVRVLPASPAGVAGLRVGDQILFVDGHPVMRARDFDRAVLFDKQKQLTLRIRRGSGEQTLTVAVEPFWTGRVRPFALGHLNETVALEDSTRRMLSEDEFAVERRLVSLANTPSAAAAHNNLGLLYESQDRFGSAIRQYQEAIKVSPREALFHYNLGMALRSIGNQDRSLEEFQATVGLAPDWAEGRLMLASELQLLRRYSEGLAIIDGTTASESELAMRRGSIAIRVGDFSGAESQYRKASEAEPDYAAASWAIGSLRFIQGNAGAPNKNELLDEGIASLRNAIVLDPNNESAYIRLGDSLIERGQLERANGAFELARRLFPRDPKPYGGLGRVAFGLGRWHEAEGYYRQALEAGATDPDTIGSLADALGNQGKLAEAIPIYKRLLAIEPSDMVSFYGLSISLRNTSRLDEALKVLNRGIAINPGFQALWEQAGFVYRSLGRLNEAEQASRKSMQLNPNATGAYDNLAMVLWLEKRFEEAVGVAREELARGPDRKEAYLALFYSLDQAGHGEGAVEAARAGLARWPDQVQFYELACLELSKLDKPEVAVSLLNRALEKYPGDSSLTRQLAWFETRHDQKMDVSLLAALAAADATLDAFHLDAVAWLRFQRGDIDGAESMLKEGLAMPGIIARERLGLLLHLGALYEKKGDAKQATSAYRDALKIDPRSSRAKEALHRLSDAP